MKLKCLSAAALFAAASSQLLLAALNPAISFRNQSVSVSGATPFGRVAWFSVAREVGNYAATIVPRSLVSRSDGEGQAAYELEGPIPPNSIWVAVDLSSGKYAVGAPAGYPLRELVVRQGLIRADSTGRPRLLSESRGGLQIFLARPNQGAWLGRVSDGAPDDVDGRTDGFATAVLTALRPVDGSAAAPEAFASNDVLALVDPTTMEIGIVRVAE